MQFSARYDGIPTALDELYTVQCDKGLSQPSIALLEHALIQIIGGFETAYLIIDALDECADWNERGKVLKWIQSITSLVPGKLHMMFTSRFVPEIERSLEDFTDLRIISLADHGTDKDILAYINTRLWNDREIWSEAKRDKIRDALTQGAGGM